MFADMPIWIKMCGLCATLSLMVIATLAVYVYATDAAGGATPLFLLSTLLVAGFSLVVTAVIRLGTQVSRLSAQVSRLDGQLDTLNTFLQSRG